MASASPDLSKYLTSVRPLLADPRFHEITYLYRYFSEEGRLLYVGVTNDPFTRHHQHRGSPWWRSARSIRIEWFPGQKLALIAESICILDEKPDPNMPVRIQEREWTVWAIWYENETGGRFIGVDPEWFAINDQGEIASYRSAPNWWQPAH